MIRYKIANGIRWLALCALTLGANGQDWAKAKLDRSPRHQEWVRVQHDGRAVQCFVVYPEAKKKAAAIVLVHEIFGLSDWARSMADDLAAAGYVAIAPDLLSGLAPGGGGTAEFPGRDAVIKAVSSLPANQVMADLQAAADYIAGVPGANGKVTVAGFCWGGGQAFRFATRDPKLRAAFVFYGPGPTDAAAIAKIPCPVYGFYGENDARVDATIPASKRLMKNAGKIFKPMIYQGAGHGFMRAGEAPDASPANKKARRESWRRLLARLKRV